MIIEFKIRAYVDEPYHEPAYIPYELIREIENEYQKFTPGVKSIKIYVTGLSKDIELITLDEKKVRMFAVGASEYQTSFVKSFA